jgi:threonine/homoserine/homoserine lactone efflux protein
MQIGSPKAFRGLAIFVVLVMVGLMLKQRGMPDFFGLLYWVVVLGGSLYLVWKGLTGRLAKAPGGWAAIMAPKLSRWMLGEGDAARTAAPDNRDQQK